MDNISLIKEGRYTGIILYPDFVVFCIFWHKTIQPSDTLYGGYISFILQKKGYIPNCYKYPQCFQPENPEICKKWVYFTIPIIMRPFEIPYSGKDIPIPSRQQYLRLLVGSIESICSRTGWKLFHYKNPNHAARKESFGFATPNPRPYDANRILG